MMAHFLKRQMGLKNMPAEQPKRDPLESVNQSLCFLERELSRADTGRKYSELEIQWLALLSHYARITKGKGDF